MKEKIRNYSTEIANAINSYLKQDDWHFSFDEEKGLFRFVLSLSSKIKKINYIVDVKEDEYIVYAISPIGADEEDKRMMATMAEFVCRANYGLKNGNDMRDGEVRFKYFVDCGSITPSKDMVQNSIHCPAIMFKRYGSGIVDIIFGNATAMETVERCEKAAENEIRSLLSELLEGESEPSEMPAKLAERMGSAEEDAKPYDAGCVPVMIKTDLFGSEGDND